MDIIIINTDISTIFILYLHLYHIKIRSLTKDNTVNRLNIRVRLCSHQENFLKFPPQDANSNEVISSDRI